MPVYTLDPLCDSRWDKLATRHSKASVFHQIGWLQALKQTYGYSPIVVTTSKPKQNLENGIVFCCVRSGITGNRLVSIPFADYAEPLLNDSDDYRDIAEWIDNESRKRKWKYIEVRPLQSEMSQSASLQIGQQFCVQTIDLRPPIDELFRQTHKSCIQSRIRHAEREGLSYERGCSEELVDDFYRLLLMTRKMQHLLPQPKSWYRNLFRLMRPVIDIRIARKGNRAIAAIWTMRHQDSVICKYSCADVSFRHFGATPFLFWKMIEESKAEGAKDINLGRSEKCNQGLIQFKKHYGAKCTSLKYWRDAVPRQEVIMMSPISSAARAMSSLLPGTLAAVAGRVVYRHLG